MHFFILVYYILERPGLAFTVHPSLLSSARVDFFFNLMLFFSVNIYAEPLFAHLYDCALFMVIVFFVAFAQKRSGLFSPRFHMCGGEYILSHLYFIICKRFDSIITSRASSDCIDLNQMNFSRSFIFLQRKKQKSAIP